MGLVSHLEDMSVTASSELSRKVVPVPFELGYPMNIMEFLI